MTEIDLDVVDKEYGKGNDPCPFCGGMDEHHLGHLILTRPGGGAVRCQVGDVRALAKALRTAREEWNTALEEIANSLPTTCRHGRDVYGTCEVCDKTDPLNCALEEAEDFLGKISRGYPPSREEAAGLLERIKQFRDGMIPE